MSTHRIFVREFLNLPEHAAGAYVLAKVEDSSRRCHPPGTECDTDCDGFWDWDATRLVIADCRRVVELDFDMATDADLRNSLHKIDLLVGVMQRFRAALHAEAALLTSRSSPSAAEAGRDRA